MLIRKLNLLWLWGDLTNGGISDTISRHLGSQYSNDSIMGWKGNVPDLMDENNSFHNRILEDGVSVNIPASSSIIRGNPLDKLVLIDPSISPFFYDLPKRWGSHSYIVPIPNDKQTIKIVKGMSPLNQLRGMSFDTLEDANVEKISDFIDVSDYVSTLGLESEREFRENYRMVRF